MVTFMTSALVYAGLAAWTVTAATVIGYWAVRSAGEPVRRPLPAPVGHPRNGSGSVRPAVGSAAACCA